MTTPFEIRPQARGTKPDDRTAEVLIYGDIGESWDDSTVAARRFVEDLQALDADVITARINSYGGSVTDGIAIYNALKRHPGVVDMHVDGVAVSIASLIAMAGDTVTMPDNALMMIHAPWGMSMGNARDMRDMAATLDKYAQAMTGAYQRAGADPEQISAWLSDGNDHWLSADEAQAARLVDIISPPLAIAASLPPRFRGPSRAQAALTNTEKATMPDTKETQAAAQENQSPATNQQQAATPEPVDTAKIEADIHAAIQARQSELKARFDHFLSANPAPERQQTIRACFDSAIGDITMTAERFTDAVLAKLSTETPDDPIVSASYSPRINGGDDQRDKLKRACADALLVRAAVPMEQRPDLQGNPFYGQRLTDIARASLKRAGIRTDGMDEMTIVANAFTQTTSDFPVLMEDTMHKSLLAGYAVESLTWRRFCAVGSVSDFRAHNRYMLGSLGDLTDLTEAGEYQNQSIPDGRKQSVSVGTKGAIINLTRQAIINDDLGAFVGLAQARGRAAARTIENTVYTAIGLASGYGPALSDGKTVIHADHGNTITSGAAPTVAQVEAGILKMAAQKDISGNDYLDLAPAILLVPKALELTARKINTETYDPAATASTKNFMTSNPYQGYFSDIVASQRLASTKWYMLANPSIAPVFEVSFLNGVQEPQMEMETGFTTDGVRWRTRMDFGVSAVGYEGIVYNAGE